MKQLVMVVVSTFAALLLSTPAKADVAGVLNVGSGCVGGGVSFTATTIDFTPAGGGNGCIQVNSPTNITYTGGGPLTSPGSGLVKDLTIGGGGVLDFMTFTGNPNLHFDLTSLGPGVANTNCATLAPCSPFAGYPLVLTATGSGTVFSFSATGTARDSSGSLSTWAGAFTGQLAGIFPLQIQQTLAGGGSVTTSYSGNFTVAPAAVPEPATILLLGTGLSGIGAAIRNRKKMS